MEDKIAEFVFRARTKAVFHIARPTLAAMPGLAEVAIHVNGSFILAKIHTKCRLISVHTSGRYIAGGPFGVSGFWTLLWSVQDELAADSEQISDEFFGTFGLPVEHRIDITRASTMDQEESSLILEHLTSLRSSGTCMRDPDKTSHYP